MKRPAIQKPEGITEVLLHACCAPCSSAIVEWLMANGVRPTIFYFNPNIYPHEEYEIRKNESKRHAESLGLRWIDGDYDHERWLQEVKELLAANKDAATFAEALKAAYPELPGDADVLAQALYK